MKNSLTAIPRVVITMGEAAGIGPELLVKIAQQKFPVQLIVLADKDLLHQIAAKLNLPLELTPIDWLQTPRANVAGQLFIEHHQLNEQAVAGKMSRANAEITLNILQRASQLAIEGQVDAIVTAPVHKGNINQVDGNFLGHTEYFAKQAGVDTVVMMLATDELRVTLATTHLPLAQVPQAITRQSLSKVLSVIVDAFEGLHINDVKVAVCGLNPHAGEGGLLGTEDAQIILPVIEQFRARNKSIFGPFPADTLFTPEKRIQYDVFLAMYHDQGLPVIKAFGFGQCANITLGLPYIRTSVDHGTALDIAAEYRASAESLEYAINYAIKLIAGKLR